MRSPTYDPRSGDCVMACINGRSVQRIVIKISTGEQIGDMPVARNIWYETNLRNGTQFCGITTWQSWCRKNKAAVLERSEQ